MVLIRPSSIVSIATDTKFKVNVEGSWERFAIVQGLQLLKQENNKKILKLDQQSRTVKDTNE